MQLLAGFYLVAAVEFFKETHTLCEIRDLKTFIQNRGRFDRARKLLLAATAIQSEMPHHSSVLLGIIPDNKTPTSGRKLLSGPPASGIRVRNLPAHRSCYGLRRSTQH